MQQPPAYEEPVSFRAPQADTDANINQFINGLDIQQTPGANDFQPPYGDRAAFSPNRMNASASSKRSRTDRQSSTGRVLQAAG